MKFWTSGNSAAFSSREGPGMERWNSERIEKLDDHDGSCTSAKIEVRWFGASDLDVLQMPCVPYLKHVNACNIKPGRVVDLLGLGHECMNRCIFIYQWYPIIDHHGVAKTKTYRKEGHIHHVLTKVDETAIDCGYIQLCQFSSVRDYISKSVWSSDL